MHIVVLIFEIALAIAVVFGLWVAAVSMPSILRYRRLRKP